MPAADNKTTWLFADVAGSARLHEKLGDAEAAHAVERCLKRVRRAVETHSGRVVSLAGDELLAYFADVESACQAAIEMQQRVATLPPVSGLELAIRVGFQVGEGHVANGLAMGEGVNGAAHMVGRAKAGQIVTSPLVERLLAERDLASFSPLISQPGARVEAYELLWEESEDIALRSSTVLPPVIVPRLCLRYRGRAYLLDERTPLLSLGRDHGNDLVIEDRKASRQHGRIERRGERYFFVDQSTNGSYIAHSGQTEMLLRRQEIELRGTGTICFGSSVNDSSADCAHFEQL